ncbi:MAG: hypothetical protein VX340_08445 [Pseudomonadota bacterium]|nr:hypothetical protein [Pseudomonadota bacterium]
MFDLVAPPRKCGTQAFLLPDLCELDANIGLWHVERRQDVEAGMHGARETGCIRPSWK